jgi:HSP20 family protein
VQGGNGAGASRGGGLPPCPLRKPGVSPGREAKPRTVQKGVPKMAITDIIPWRSQRWPAIRREDPFNYIQQQMNRMFDETLGFPPLGAAGRTEAAFTPPVEISETEDEIRLLAEVPGIEAKDLDVDVTAESLVLRGEKREERQSAEQGRYLAERSYGRFERQVALPAEVDAEKARAKFKDGVLEVTLPKLAGAKPKHHKVKIG